jgi:hypothetical protein
MSTASIRAAFAAMALALAPGLALAGPQGLPASAPVVEVTFPDDWQVAKTNLTLETSPRGKDMLVAYRLVAMGDFTRAMKDWEAWAARQGIALKEEGKSIKKFQFEGGDSISHRRLATDRSGDTIVMRTILKLSEERLLFITEWGAESATRAYASELRSIRRSVTKLP